MTWINPTTGEVLERWQEGAVPDSPAPAWAEGQDDREWLAPWYLRKLARIRNERALVKRQAAAIIEGLDREERGHLWKWERRFEAVALEELERAGKKTKVMLYGTVGTRPRRGVDVVDKEAALAWAEVHAPAAVKVTRSLLKSELPEGEAVPGVERRTGREFFIKAGGRAHPCASGPACVAGVGTVDKRGERCGECVAADGAKP